MNTRIPNGLASLNAVTCLQAVPGLTGEAAAASTLVSLQQAADPGARAICTRHLGITAAPRHSTSGERSVLSYVLVIIECDRLSLVLCYVNIVRGVCSVFCSTLVLLCLGIRAATAAAPKPLHQPKVGPGVRITAQGRRCRLC